MTLDDLKRQIKDFRDFWRFWAAMHISKANCAEFTRNRQAAHEIFSIERTFQRFKSHPSRFKETCAREHQIAVPQKSRYFTVVGTSTVKTVADRHGYGCLSQQALVTNFLVVSTSITLKDPELQK